MLHFSCGKGSDCFQVMTESKDSEHTMKERKEKGYKPDFFLLIFSLLRKALTR
jgi:hypothetical protein